MGEATIPGEILSAVFGRPLPSQIVRVHPPQYVYMTAASCVPAGRTRGGIVLSSEDLAVATDEQEVALIEAIKAVPALAKFRRACMSARRKRMSPMRRAA